MSRHERTFLLRVICERCGGDGREITSYYGGNDPDTWDAGPCQAKDCDGGMVPAEETEIDEDEDVE